MEARLGGEARLAILAGIPIVPLHSPPTFSRCPTMDGVDLTENQADFFATTARPSVERAGWRRPLLRNAPE